MGVDMTRLPTELPSVITAYQSAHDQHDVDTALAAFTEDAVVRDEDQDWAGAEQIRQWLTKTSNEYTFSRTLLGVEPIGTHGWLVRKRLEGNFQGGVVDLRYTFELDGDHIAKLAIAP